MIEKGEQMIAWGLIIPMGILFIITIYIMVDNYLSMFKKELIGWTIKEEQEELKKKESK